MSQGEDGVFKQGEKVMICVLSSSHLNCVEAEPMLRHLSLKCHFTRLLSIVQCGCKIYWNVNLMLLYPEIYLLAVFVLCACTFCFFFYSIHSIFIVDSIENWHTDTEKMEQDCIILQSKTCRLGNGNVAVNTDTCVQKSNFQFALHGF